MTNHKNIQDDDEFVTVMASVSTKLVIVDFGASWCGPCQQIQPVYTQMAKKYPEALFLCVSYDVPFSSVQLITKEQQTYLTTV